MCAGRRRRDAVTRIGLKAANFTCRAAALSVTTLVCTTTAGYAASPALGLDADECAVQHALLGKAAPGCPPPRAFQPEPPPPPPPPPQVSRPAPEPPKVAEPAPPAAMPPIHPPLGAIREVQAESASFLILFAVGSDRIDPRSEKLMGTIAAAMNSPQGMSSRFRIIGHTDATGTAAKNLALSRSRAASIRDWLVNSGHVDAKRLDVVGLGQDYLADPAHPSAATNRRVEIVRLISSQER